MYFGPAGEQFDGLTIFNTIYTYTISIITVITNLELSTSYNLTIL